MKISESRAALTNLQIIICMVRSNLEMMDEKLDKFLQMKEFCNQVNAAAPEGVASLGFKIGNFVPRFLMSGKK